MPYFTTTFCPGRSHPIRLARAIFALLALVLGGCASDGLKPSVIQPGTFRNPAVGFKGLDLTLPADWRLVTQDPDPAKLSGYTRAAYESIRVYADKAVGSRVVEHNIWEFENGAVAILIVTTAHPWAGATDKATKKLYADLVSSYLRTDSRHTERKVLEVNGRYVPTFSSFYPSKGVSDRLYISTLPPGYEVLVYGVYGIGGGLDFDRQATALVEQINR